MSEIFADTSGWGNLFDTTQPFHRLAASTYLSAIQTQTKIVTSNYVLLELVALMARPLKFTRSRIGALVDDIRRSPNVDIVHVDANLNDDAWQLYKSRPDKEWSLVDCASFVVMTQHGISESLSSDRHFEQAGFVCLLK
jgi:predicted nucleic acid-binding protein